MKYQQQQTFSFRRGAILCLSIFLAGIAGTAGGAWSAAANTQGGFLKKTSAEIATGLSFASVFTDNAVLQRGTGTKIFGYGQEGDVVTVKFDGQEKQSRISGGKWSVELNPLTESFEGKTLTAQTQSQTLSLSNVCIGEVWLCVGQSNMELPLQYVKYNGYKDYDNVDKIRVFNVENGTSVSERAYFSGKSQWVTPSKIEDLSAYSAYAVGFALKLQEGLGNVPVGVVQSDTSGSAIEEWMNAESIKQTGSVAEEMGKKPTERYNQMIYPMVSFAFGGLLWYQGEANCVYPALYKKQFSALIGQYRREFCDMPIVTAQLPAYGDSRWPQFRQMQWEATKEQGVYAVCGIDLGLKGDIHPTDKYEFSARAGELALTVIYHKEGFRGVSPYPVSLINDGGKVTVSFADDAIEIVNRAETVSDFALCGVDGVYYPADAEIREGKIILSSAKVPAPVKARYAYAAVPAATLFTADNLPLAPFEQAVENEYVTVHAEAGEGGSVKGNFGSVIKNSVCSYTFVCDKGYKIDKILVNGEACSSVDGALLLKADENKSIAVSFVKIPVFSVRVSCGKGGKIFSGLTEAEEGGTVKIYIVPEKGYKISSVKVNGEERTATDGVCTIEGIEKNMAVEAVFSKKSGCSSVINAGAGFLAGTSALFCGWIIRKKSLKKSLRKQEEKR